MSNLIDKNNNTYSYAGTFTLALRLVVGWTYFSAFWRRVALADKLNPDAAGYIGAKFNHFLPKALLIGDSIEYLVTHEDLLWWVMFIFTIIEGVVGLLFMLGFMTRLMSIGVSALAFGILLGAGWLGTTCLDEWQIGVLGVAAGFTVFLSGGGRYSIDGLLSGSFSRKTRWNITGWLFSGPLPVTGKFVRKLAVYGAAAIVFLTLFTNQYFHGGVWGHLHNPSVKPHITITEASLNKNELSFKVYRDEGADVYGSFLVNIRLEDAHGNIVLDLDEQQLSEMSSNQIINEYLVKVHPGKHSLEIPLGAKALLRFITPKGLDRNQSYRLTLTDVSGLTWEHELGYGK